MNRYAANNVMKPQESGAFFMLYCILVIASIQFRYPQQN